MSSVWIAMDFSQKDLQNKLWYEFKAQNYLALHSRINSDKLTKLALECP